MSETEDTSAKLPALPSEPHLLATHEGASAFPVDDPFVRLIFTYGSFIPGTDAYYESAEAQMQGFIEAVFETGFTHPELALQYAAWLRDPRQGKGNRSQPPWVLAVLSGLRECLEHPRFSELVARSIVRPDDALYLIQATVLYLGDNQFPPALLAGIATGLDRLSDYQLTKYAHAALNLLPRKKEQRRSVSSPTLPGPAQQGSSSLPAQIETGVTPVEKPGTRTLRLVDVLGICKRELSPRLFALYRYLHAPTRQQAELLPLLEHHLPLFGVQKELRQHPPRQVSEVQAWVGRALAARMTMEQMFSATGLEPGQRLLLKKLTLETEELASEPLSSREQKQQKQGLRKIQAEILHDLQPRDVLQGAIRSELWKALVEARVPGEHDPAQSVAMLGDVAFLRNIRGMYQAGIPLKTLIDEAQRRRFPGIWPFQLLSAARTLENGKKRGTFHAEPCPQVLPVIDTIFERVALETLPRKSAGTLYHLLGLADVSGSMGSKLGGKMSSATCMDAALAFTTAFSYTSEHHLAGTWDNNFHPVEGIQQEGPLSLVKRIMLSGGMGGGGTQVFGSMIQLMNWLSEHPRIKPPEVLVVLSDMQFHPPSTIEPALVKRLPQRYQSLLLQPKFRRMPPLAAAIVLYRAVLGTQVSLVLWNLASYQGSPAPSGMERVLMLSGFDTNSFRIIEQWLQAGSPGTAMPTDPTNAPAGSGQSNSSFEAVLAALRRY
ncbi:MAG TPA: hypothetical protein VGD98_18865 [Ktedonobacteraceae bacterium]